MAGRTLWRAPDPPAGILRGCCARRKPLHGWNGSSSWFRCDRSRLSFAIDTRDASMPWLVLFASLAFFQAAPPGRRAHRRCAGSRVDRTNEARFDALTAILRASNSRSRLRPSPSPSRSGPSPHRRPQCRGHDRRRRSGDRRRRTLRRGPVARRHAESGSGRQAASSVSSRASRRRCARSRRRCGSGWSGSIWRNWGSSVPPEDLESHASAPIAGMLNFDVNGWRHGGLRAHQPRSQELRETLALTCIECGATVCPPRMPPGDDLSFSKADIPTISMACCRRWKAPLWLLMNAKGRAGRGTPSAPARYARTRRRSWTERRLRRSSRNRTERVRRDESPNTVSRSIE